MSFWSKRIKNEKDIAKALNVSEDKIKALKNDELTIGGNTMDKTLKAIEEERINKAIRENDIWKWILETDFKKKRKEFGYDTQSEVAKLIGCDTSIICNLEKHKDRFKRVSPRLVDIYNFYTNDFNKKIVSKETKSTTIDTKNVYHLKQKVNKDNKHIWKWYKNTDLKQLRLDKGYKTIKDVYKQIGVCQSCISDLELKKFRSINKTMINAYNFYNNIEADKKDNDTIKLEPNENNTFVPEESLPKVEVIEEKEETQETQETQELLYKIEYLEKLNEKYEKIIDKLIERF